MKISYERLNQIIEEEVVRFKRLNEEQETNTTSTLKPTDVAQTIKDGISSINDVQKLRDALMTAVGKIQDTAILKQVQGTLGIQDKK